MLWLLLCSTLLFDGAINCLSRGTVLVFWALLTFVFAMSFVNLIALSDTGTPVTTIRGSIRSSLASSSSFTLFVVAGVLGLILFVIPSCITVVLFSILLVKYVKKQTIDDSNNFRR